MSTRLSALQKRCTELHLQPCRGLGITADLLEKKIQEAEGNSSKVVVPQKKQIRTLGVTKKATKTTTRKIVPKTVPGSDLGPVLQNVSLASLVCEMIRSPSITENDVEDVISLLRHCSGDGECDPCTRLSEKLARSLIRIASERIFAEPEQSIIELVVNSIDAYLPESKIGKFGMGFFSVLYWISPGQDPLGQRRLIIRSSVNGYDYEAVIRYDPASKSHMLSLSTKVSNTTAGGHTTMLIEFGVNKLPLESVTLMRNQLAKLYYKEGVVIRDIALKAVKAAKVLPIENMEAADKQSQLPVVEVLIDQSQVQVSDRATGVPLPVLFGSLLVPSISTKGLQLNTVDSPDTWVGRSGVYVTWNNQHRLLVCVGGVGVVSFSFVSERLRKDIEREFYDFVIALPLSTKIPVSRDDVIIEDTEPFVYGLETILETAVELGVLYELEELLNTYTNYTVNRRNRGIVLETLQRMHRVYADRIVPHPYLEYYKMIDRYFVGSKRYDVWRVRDALASRVVSDEKVFEGKRVIMIDGPKHITVTHIGLSDYLIVNTKYVKKNPNWKTDTAASYYGEQLIPYGEKTGRTILDAWIKYLPEKGFDADDKKIFLSTMGTIWALVDRFTYDSVQEVLPKFAKLLVRTKILDQTHDGWWRALCIELQNSLVSQKGNSTYGGQKAKINISLTFKWDSIASPLVLRYCYEDILERIRHPISNGKRCEYRFMHSSSTAIAYSGIKAYPRLERSAREHATNGAHYTYIAFIITPTAQRPYKEMLPYEEIVQELSKRMVAGAVEWSSHIWAFEADVYGNSILEELFREYRIWYDLLKGIKLERHDEISPVSLGALGSHFMLSQLIERTIYSEIAPDTIPSLFDELGANHDAKRLPLQIVEIAVNEGTTKNVVEASLTELLQNSIDALKESNLPVPQRVITVNAYSATQYFVLEVSDPVGMDAWAFIHLSIPFLSTKTAQSITTGEMGSGFFNVYRGSEYVYIETRKNGQYIKSWEQPIRNGGRVVDIEKTVQTGKTSSTNGTIVRIFYPSEKTIETLGVLEYQLNSVFSLVDPNVAMIQYKTRSVSVEKELYWSGRFGSTPNSPQYEIYLMDKIYPSYILTKGVPFAPIEDYIPTVMSVLPNIDLLNVEQYLRRGVVINIVSGYSPVQTRTRVKTEAGTLEQALVRALYLSHGYKAYQDSENDKHPDISNYKSTADSRQLRYYDDLGVYFRPLDVFLYYDFANNRIRTHGKNKGIKTINVVSPTTTATYAQIINEGISIMQDKHWETVKTQMEAYVKKAIPANLLPSERSLLTYLLIGWFRNKNKNTEPELSGPTIKRPTLLEDEDLRYPTFYKFLQTFVAEYTALAREIGIYGYENDQVSRLWLVKGDSNPQAAGWYSLGSKELVLSTLSLDHEKLESLASSFVANMKENALAVSTAMRADDNWDRVFSISTPCTTIIHEIEHARRQVGTHDNWTEALWDGDLARTRSFDEGANDVYRKLIEHGLYDRVMKRYQ